MEPKLQILLLSSCLITLIIIINMIKKEKLDLKYSLLWILICISIGILSLFSNSITFIAKVIGVATPVNALFLLGLVSVLFILFTLTIAESRKSKRIKELTQRLAILENKLESVGKHFELEKSKELENAE